MTQRGRAGARSGPGGRRPAARQAPTEQAPPAAPRIDLTAARVRVSAVVEPVLAARGYDLEQLDISRAGRRHVVRVLVDTDGGVRLDDVATVSREISAALDAAEEGGAEVLAGEYQLEVGSPGVDRPLTLARHWRRNVGRLVAVRVDGRDLVGRVTAAGDEGVVLDVDGAVHEVGHDRLGAGRVQVEFHRMETADLGADDDDLGVDDEDDAVDDDEFDDLDDVDHHEDDEDGKGEKR